jgi:hypothetical protein
MNLTGISEECRDKGGEGVKEFGGPGRRRLILRQDGYLRD